jgi:hypothetical protein
VITFTSTNSTVFACIDRAAGTVVAQVQIELLDQFLSASAIGDDIDSTVAAACKELVPDCGPVGLDLQEYINYVEFKLTTLELN